MKMMLKFFYYSLLTIALKTSVNMTHDKKQNDGNKGKRNRIWAAYVNLNLPLYLW